MMETLRNEQRLEVWITTTRPWLRMDNVDPDTRHWLNMHFPCYDHLLYGDDKYRMLADRVDPHRVVAIFEDLPEKYEEAVHYFGSAACLVERPHNEWYRRHDGYMATTVSDLATAAIYAEERIEGWHRQHATGS
jgi:hypothetical protein